MKKVAIVMGSDSDAPVMAKAVKVLEGYEIPYEVHVYSAHRTPMQAAEFASNAKENGFGVIIAGAGMAAALAGVLAAHTTLPVIGVPLKSAVLEGTDEEVAKDVAMQIAAMRPLYLDKDSVPTERVEKEREILTEQAENEGLDANKLPMIVNGRLNKFFEEICLVDQGFVKENKMKVSKYVESKNMKVLSFVRYEVGEGMEKREENFADEVAKQMNA